MNSDTWNAGNGRHCRHNINQISKIMKQATVTQIEKIWLSNKEAQAYLGVGMDFFKNLRSSGRISFFKVGTTVFYRKRDIDKLIEKNRVC